MATLQITLKDLKFISTNGVNVEKFMSDYVEGNGWKALITQDGNVDCIATMYYGGIRHQIKLKIDNGYVKLLLKIGGNRPKALKAYQLDEWPIDGVIGLPNGFIDNRRAYFRDSAFQDFLNKHNITAVRCESANGIYLLKQEIHDVTIFEETIETDGNSELIFNDVDYPKKDDTKSFIVFWKVEITKATWVIKTVKKLGVVKHRILYTADNPQKIVGLPKLK